MDRRQRKTRKAIYVAFEELLGEHHYSDVTVANIIDRADIGRSTFYAHFATKDELLEHMCTELFAHVFDGVDVDPHTHESLEVVTLEGMIAHLLCHLRDSHGGICGKLLAEGEPHFSSRFRERLSSFLSHHLPERTSWVPDDLMLAFLVGCFCQAIAWWRDQAYETSPEKLAHWYTRALGLECQSHTTRGANS